LVIEAMRNIASMTKPVVGVSIMMLVEEGKLHLSDPVARFIPQFASMKVAVSRPGSGGSEGPSFYTVPAQRPITIKDLLTHTSGLGSGPMGESEIARVARKEGEKLEGAGPLAKNIGEERTEAIRLQLGLADGDAAFFVAGDPKKFVSFAGAARTRAGEELNLVDRERFELCWIVDFPFFEWNEDEKKIDFAHNPFSMPQGGIDALNGDDLLGIKAFQYDMVCNGFEIASGGIRNHLPETMVKAFETVGLDRATVEERFGGLYRAFQYGAPPHGGMAAGVDRVVMLLVGAKNLREITMFPMNQQAYDLLMNAPSEASPQQLRDLSLRVAVTKKEV